MVLWVDKYRPKTLDQCTFHAELSKQLIQLAASPDFPHLLICGPSGAGKKTRIVALLRAIYGPGADRVKVEHKAFKLPSSKTIELTTLSSNYHIEINPGDAGFYDRNVVQDTIKEIASTVPIGSQHFKVIVLNEVDRLSREAQAALRRTMEKYTRVCRLILCCSSITQVIEPVRSRCLLIRVPAPSIPEIVTVLQTVAKEESITLPPELALRIATTSERNLRKAILSLEATKTKQYPFLTNQKVDRCDWEEYIAQIASNTMSEQSPKQLLLIRGKFYELLTHCIPPEIIIRRLTMDLLRKCDSQLKPEIIEWAAFYEHRLRFGSKAIFHLEAFVARVMSLCKTFLIAEFGS